MEHHMELFYIILGYVAGSLAMWFPSRIERLKAETARLAVDKAISKISK